MDSPKAEPESESESESESEDNILAREIESWKGFEYALRQAAC